MKIFLNKRKKLSKNDKKVLHFKKNYAILDISINNNKFSTSNKESSFVAKTKNIL